MQQQRILVTGASGLIGRALVPVLARQGHRVTAVSRRQQLDVPCAAVLACDLAATPPPREVLARIDTVVHMAGDSGASGASLEQLRPINVEAARRLALAAADAGVKRFVHVSSIKVHGEFSPAHASFDEHSPLAPATPYAQSRCEAEQALAEVAAHSAMAVVTARPVAVFGAQAPANFARLARWIAQGRPLPVVTGSLRSVLSVDSAASALALLATHRGAAGRIFVVADPEPLAMTQIVSLLAQAMGRRSRLLVLPGFPLSTLVRRFAAAGALARLVLPLQADAGRLLGELDWQPVEAPAQALLRYAGRW